MNLNKKGGGARNVLPGKFKHSRKKYALKKFTSRALNVHAPAQ